MAAIEISPVEVLALKKLALINGALAQMLATIEQFRSGAL